MFKLLNNAGGKYRSAIYHYMKRIIRDEDIPEAFNLTCLIAIWKKKGSALDLNQMRYIHTKLWDAKLHEALVTTTRHMKPKIVKACTQHPDWRNAKIFQCETLGNHEDMDENHPRIQSWGNNQHL
mgnify:CR=1 FL=1